jgi:hypothetical protein
VRGRVFRSNSSLAKKARCGVSTATPNARQSAIEHLAKMKIWKLNVRLVVCQSPGRFLKRFTQQKRIQNQYSCGKKGSYSPQKCGE